jgi:dUTP pyrophosphatase
MQIEIPVINIGEQSLPEYATQGAAGMDLRAAIKEAIILQPLERTLVATGLQIAVPIGYEAQIRPRSGQALQQGLTCLNSPGTIDSDYRGEVKVLLINLSNEAQTIEVGQRIAQIVFAPVAKASFKIVATLPTTERSEGGFGSTGKN